MNVFYLFSSNKAVGSRLIAWAAGYEGLNLEKYPSHVAVLLDNEWVFESTMVSGVRVVPYSSWLQMNEELYKLPCMENSYGPDILRKAASLWGRSYDWPGFFYFALCYVKLILFKKALPEQNKWQRKNAYFCSEYASLLRGADYSMKSPARICKEMLADYYGW